MDGHAGSESTEEVKEQTTAKKLHLHILVILIVNPIGVVKEKVSPQGSDQGSLIRGSVHLPTNPVLHPNCSRLPMTGDPLP